MAQPYEMLTTSHFARAISVTEKHHTTKIHRHRDEGLARKNLEHIPPIKCCVEQESIEIDGYQHMPGNVVNPTGIWMLHKNIMGASPNGHLFTYPHAASAVGIIEGKCNYSVLDLEIGCDSDWHHYLHYHV